MSAESLTPAASDLSTILGNAIPGILAQLSRKMNIDQLKAQAGKIGNLDISKIILGDVTIDKLVVSDTNATLNRAAVDLQDVTMTFHITICVRAGVSVFGLDFGGSISLPTINIPFNAGNITVPNLSGVTMDIGKMNVPPGGGAVPGATATVQPINNLDLGGTSFKKMKATDTDAPADGFTMSGLGVGGATVEGVDVPKTSTVKVTVEEFKPDNNITLPPVEITNLNLPSVEIPNVTTSSFVIDGNASSRSTGEFNLGPIYIEIILKPSFTMNINRMVINDIELFATINKINIEGVSVPVTVRGISMDDLDIEKIHINKIDMQ